MDGKARVAKGLTWEGVREELGHVARAGSCVMGVGTNRLKLYGCYEMGGGGH